MDTTNKGNGKSLDDLITDDLVTEEKVSNTEGNDKVEVTQGDGEEKIDSFDDIADTLKPFEDKEVSKNDVKSEEIKDDEEDTTKDDEDTKEDKKDDSSEEEVKDTTPKVVADLLAIADKAPVTIKENLKSIVVELDKDLSDSRSYAIRYNFARMIKGIVESDSRFDDEFKIIEELFKNGKDTIFSLVNLHKYDYKWTGNGTDYKFYNQIVSFIHAMIGEDSEINKSILNVNNIACSDIGKQNLMKYYELD